MCEYYLLSRHHLWCQDNTLDDYNSIGVLPVKQTDEKNKICSSVKMIEEHSLCETGVRTESWTPMGSERS